MKFVWDIIDLVHYNFRKCEKLPAQARWLHFSNSGDVLDRTEAGSTNFESMIRSWLKSDIPELKNLRKICDRDISASISDKLKWSIQVATRDWRWSICGWWLPLSKFIRLETNHRLFLVQWMESLYRFKVYSSVFWLKWILPCSSNFQKALLAATSGNLVALKLFNDWFENKIPEN